MAAWISRRRSVVSKKKNKKGGGKPLGLTTYWAARSSSTDGANGIQKSRDLIASLIIRTAAALDGDARIERFPRALAPNSSRPLNRATISPAASKPATLGSIGACRSTFTGVLKWK